MSDPAETYFPDERPAWDFVRNDFPFPLAITCTRLLGEMERQEPIAAAWALRDAFECIIKFSASLAVADFMNAGPDPTAAGEVAQLLLKPSGLSLGDWHTLLEKALDPLKPLARVGRLSESRRTLPSLFGIFFDLKGRLPRTPLNNRIGGQGDNFVAWRNRVFGHGVFSRNRNYYAQEALAWLPTLGDFYAALRPVLADRRLISRTPGGDEVVWQGTDDLPDVPRHEHDPWGDPLPMFLAPAPGFNLPSLPLTPFLSMQQCQSCGQPAAFFFDKNKYDRKQDRHATAFLEYFNGHPGTHKNWTETRRVAALLPPTFDWERTSYDAEEVDGSQEIIFRDFAAEYQRPDYLLDAVWQITEEQPKGYIHVVGPGGMGKTYFIRGLAAEGKEQGVAVLAYHILPGARTDARTFLSELNAYARDTLRFRTQEPQIRGNTAGEMQAEFVFYLSELKRANRVDLLIVAIDALDELADPADRSAGITDFLPSPDLLPGGCFFVLTSREELRPKIRADVTRLQAAPPEGYTSFTLGTSDTANQGLLRAYLTKHLPTPLQVPGAVDAVLLRCGGVFLYAFHFCRALEAGVFPDVIALPDGETFYPAYLERLRARVGDHLYDTVYLPTLLLLCAAQRPVTLDQLAHWGVPYDRLLFALLDLRDFLRVYRTLKWQDILCSPIDIEDCYELAHEDFRQFISRDSNFAPRLRATHGIIAKCALVSQAGHWEGNDPTRLTDLYDLRFVLVHLEAADLPEASQSLLLDGTYGSACSNGGQTAANALRYLLAVDLFTLSIRVKSSLRESMADARMLIMTLTRKGIALTKLGRLSESLACYEEVYSLYRSLLLGAALECAPEEFKQLLTSGVGMAELEVAAARIAEAQQAGAQQADTSSAAVEFFEDMTTFLSSAMGTAMVNRGITLTRMGRPAESLIFFDFAKSLSPTDSGYDPAISMVNKGIALNQLGRHVEALNCSDAAIGLYSSLFSVSDEQIETLAQLAMSIDLATVHRSSTAAATNPLAATLMRMYMLNGMATAQINKGVALNGLGRSSDGLECIDEAGRIYQSLMSVFTNADGIEFLAMRRAVMNGHAAALVNKGIVLNSLGQPAEGLECFDAATVYQRLQTEDAEMAVAETLMDDPALALLHKGIALNRLGRLAEALQCCAQAVIAYQSLKDAGRVDLSNNLALALVSTSNILNDIDQSAEALKFSIMGVKLYASQLQAAMTTETTLSLLQGSIMATVSMGVALKNLGSPQEALEQYGELIAFLRTSLSEESLSEESTRVVIEANPTIKGTLANYLALVLTHKGIALNTIGRSNEALDCCAEAVMIYKSLWEVAVSEEIDPAKRAVLMNDMAMAFLNKAIALGSLERSEEELDCYNDVISVINPEVQAGRKHLLSFLIKVLGDRFDFWRRQEQWANAAEDVTYVFAFVAASSNEEAPSAMMLQEFQIILLRLIALSSSQRSQLYAALGEWAETVRYAVDAVEEEQAQDD